MEISNVDIGNRVRQLRKECGYTQEQLAEYAEISVDFLGLIETGRSSMKVQNLAKIASILNVTTDYLIYGTSPYKENARINTMLSVVPDSKRKQVEKLIALFLNALRSDEDD
ncbi:MAG: helix-turn-helix transcriptional regulator [Oscillospiraceae bacterium]|nr:helix-turn-helix transcriptional regulator [Oscillospiraceae bacterium]